MSLIKCPECGKQVSDQANACPDCGYPIKSNNPKGKVAIKIANGLAGTVKIYNVDDYKNVLLWQGKAGQIAEFYVEEAVTIDIVWGFGKPSLLSKHAKKVKGNEKYELSWQESFFNRDLVLNRVDVIDSGR